LVIFVGFEKVGIARSTRALSGATGTLDGTNGCSIVLAACALGAGEAPLASAVAEALDAVAGDAGAGVDGAPDELTGGTGVLPHATARRLITTISGRPAVDRGRRAKTSRRPVRCWSISTSTPGARPMELGPVEG
jgi:hypothetical protein